MPATIGTPVADGVGRIAGFVNAYVLHDDSGLYLIDTTMSRHAKPVVRAFESANVAISQVTTIVLTHQHPDHIRGAATVADASHARVVSHQADAPVIEGKVPAKMPLLMRLFVRVRPVPVGWTVKDEDPVGPFRIVYVPGHTPGEIALYHPAKRWLFSGDSVVEHDGHLTLPSVRVASDPAEAVRSLSVLRRLDVEVLFPGHGDPVGHDVAGQLDALLRRVPKGYPSPSP